MMQAVSTSETSANIYDTTRRNIPEGCHPHKLRKQNKWKFKISEEKKE
jgi:hypothetical protein